MNALRRLFGRANPGRELSLIGREQRRRKVNAVARQIREELGLPEDRRLNS